MIDFRKYSMVYEGRMYVQDVSRIEHDFNILSCYNYYENIEI